jgi:hypothetical protein
MQGYDYEGAKADVGTPESIGVMAMIAIGKRGPQENPAMKLQGKGDPKGVKPLG